PFSATCSRRWPTQIWTRGVKSQPPPVRACSPDSAAQDAHRHKPLRINALQQNDRPKTRISSPAHPALITDRQTRRQISTPSRFSPMRHYIPLLTLALLPL